MIGWGMLTMLTALVKTRTQLISLRMCIGALEAGFYPATVFYLSLFYTRYEFAQRLGMFYGQYAVAGAFGGLVSYVVFSLFPGGEEEDGDVEGWKSYQVLFVLEGVLTIVVAVVTLLWLPTGPGTAWWLTPQERVMAEDRVVQDRAAMEGDPGPVASYDPIMGSDSEDDLPASTLHHRHGTPVTTHSLLLSPRRTPLVGGEPALTRHDVYSAFTDPKIWVLLALNILSSLPATAFSIFLPLILRGLNHSPLAANLLTIPPFLLGAATLWTVTYLSDRDRVRFRYILLGLGINATGLLAAVVLPDEAYTSRYLALCVLLSGSYIASPLTVAWISGNIQLPGKRAVVLGINGWGNVAGVVAGWLFEPKWAPGYRVPLVVTLGCVLVSAGGYAGFVGWVKRENREREVGRGVQRVGRWRQWGWERVGGKGEFVAGGEEKWGVRYGV